MPPEYKTLRFPKTNRGWQEKDWAVNQMAAQGWRVASESMVQGTFKGDKACCLASICLPLGFTAGQTPGLIVVTLVRDSIVPVANSALPGPPCAKCGQYSPAGAKFCQKCGGRMA